VLTLHPTLLVGPYDWDAERLPKSEFCDRIQALWAKIPDRQIVSAAVYGDSLNHAELAYLSNFVPKLGPAFLFIPRHGEPRLLVSGAPNMLPAAQRLTWIARVEPLRDAGRTMRQWLSEFPPSSVSPSRQSVALIGGEYMPGALFRPFIDALAPENLPVDATAWLRTLMRYKRPKEMAAIREACAMLGAATKALAEAKGAGVSVATAIFEAERAAHHAGAQDVRTLFSLDGGRTLRPFEKPINMVMDPLQAYFAVCHVGYWAEGFVVLTTGEHPTLAQATEGLRAAIRIVRRGTQCRELVDSVSHTIAPYSAHPITAGNIGNSIGLFLEEAPRLLAGSEESLEDGGVYTVRAGVSDGCGQHAIVSAMVAVHQDGNEALWSAI
jgi:Xaa-Pro aminopeptidase